MPAQGPARKLGRRCNAEESFSCVLVREFVHWPARSLAVPWCWCTSEPAVINRDVCVCNDGNDRQVSAVILLTEPIDFGPRFTVQALNLPKPSQLLKRCKQIFGWDTTGFTAFITQKIHQGISVMLIMVPWLLEQRSWIPNWQRLMRTNMRPGKLGVLVALGGNGVQAVIGGWSRAGLGQVANQKMLLWWLMSEEHWQNLQ